jgi:hypothetical protein
MTLVIGDPEDWWNPDDWVYTDDWDYADDVIKQIKELEWEDDVRGAEAADPDDAA